MASDGGDDLRVLQRQAGKKYLDPAHVPPSSAELTARRLAERGTRGERERGGDVAFRCACCNEVLPRKRWDHVVCDRCGAERRVAPAQPKGDIAPTEIGYVFGIAAYSWNPTIK